MKVKWPVLVVTLLAGAVSVHSQGIVSLQDSAIQVFRQQPAQFSTRPVAFGGYTGLEEMGITVTPGYGGGANLGSFLPGTEAGAGYSIQLLAAAGPGAPVSSLVPVGPVVTTWNISPPGFWTSTATVN